MQCRCIVNNIKIWNKYFYNCSQASIVAFRPLHRTLFTAEELKISEYVEMRKNQQKSNNIKFRAHIEKTIQNEHSDASVMTENFHLYLTMMNDTPEDADLLIRFIAKLETLENYRKIKNEFGPKVMQMCHHFKNDGLAIKCFDHAVIKQFFAQQFSHQIFMDLMYKNEQYDVIIENYEELLNSMQLANRPISKYIFPLIMAACYKQNTTASYNYATKLTQNHTNLKYNSRNLVFFSGLALNQNDPAVALNSIINVPQYHHVAICNIKALAFIKMNYIDKTLSVLRTILDRFGSNNMKSNVISIEVMEEIEQYIQQNGTSKEKFEFRIIQNDLKHQHFLTEQTLDSLICMPTKNFPLKNHELNKISMAVVFNQLK